MWKKIASYFKPKEIVDQPVPLINGGTTEATGSDSGGDGLSQNSIPDVNIPKRVVASEVISESLDTQARAIKGNFTFDQMGAITIGNVSISPDGILVVNNLGSPMVTITDEGDATFYGTVAAGAVIATTIDATQITGQIVNAQLANIEWAKIVNVSVATAQIQNAAITNAKINDLSADKITAGTITVGGTGHSDAIVLQRDSGGTGTKLRWEGGSRIWSDSSNKMGINAIGGELTIYCNSDEIVFVGNGNVNINRDLHPKSIDFNTSYQNEGAINNLGAIHGYNDIQFYGNGDYYFYRDNSGNAGTRIEWGTGKIYSYSSTINLGGSDKTAIVPTSRGYKALYSMESPEVWFMDFCKGEKKFTFHNTWKFWKWGFDWIAHPDLTFLEVTVPGYLIMPTLVKGIVQVWGHRKGHENKRFEEKTEAEFKKNEQFLGMAKVK